MNETEMKKAGRNGRHVLCSSVFWALLIIVAFFGGGIGLTNLFPPLLSFFRVVCPVCIFLSLALVVVSCIRLFLTRKKMKGLSVADANELTRQAKENARNVNRENGSPYEAAEKVKKAVSGAKRQFYALVILSCAALLCLNGSTIGTILFLVPSGILISFTYQFVGILHSRYDWSEYADEADYPVIYGIAKRAAGACGVKKPIRIVFQHGYDVGIADIRDHGKSQISLIVSDGVTDLFTEDELYQVFLHEFSHLLFESTATPVNSLFVKALTYECPDPRVVNPFITVLLPYEIFNMEFESMIYDLAASEFVERIADENAAKLGDPVVFASALVKLFFTECAALITLYEMEPADLPYAGEKPLPDILTRENARFRTLYRKYSGHWFSLIPVEKQGANATHPVVRERLASIHVPLDKVDVSLPDEKAATPLRDEVKKIFADLNRKSAGYLSEDYAEHRKESYLDLLETAKRFDENGKTCPPEEYRSVVYALDGLCRTRDAVEFCQRTIADESVAKDSKWFLFSWLGKYLLSYDREEGLALMYEAGEGNSNFVDEAIFYIGSYCCRNGLEDEYLKYRTTAERWAQRQKDITEKMGDLSDPKKLSAEHFPPEKMKTLLDFIVNSGNEKLKAVYLVRQTITEDAFSSIFTLEYTDDATADERAKIYDQVFNFLDTSPEEWQYSLLDYQPAYQRIFKKIDGSCVWRKEQ